MLRRPPRSTLFPYTTLFRSARQKFLEENAHFHLGEMLPQTEMGTVAEREMAVWLAIDPKLTWIFERSEEHTSELQSRVDLVCRLLLEKKNKENKIVERDSTQ